MTKPASATIQWPSTKRTKLHHKAHKHKQQVFPPFLESHITKNLPHSGFLATSSHLSFCFCLFPANFYPGGYIVQLYELAQTARRGVVTLSAGDPQLPGWARYNPREASFSQRGKGSPPQEAPFWGIRNKITLKNAQRGRGDVPHRALFPSAQRENHLKIAQRGVVTFHTGTFSKVPA